MFIRLFGSLSKLCWLQIPHDDLGILCKLVFIQYYTTCLQKLIVLPVSATHNIYILYILLGFFFVVFFFIILTTVPKILCNNMLCISCKEEMNAG